jgi:hypothetical protein
MVGLISNALLSKGHAEAINAGYADSRTPAERTRMKEHVRQYLTLRRAFGFELGIAGQQLKVSAIYCFLFVR